MLPCLLTDPSATELSLRMDNGTSSPPGMNFTVDRHRGILIHSLHPSFNADYVCTAKVNGVERTSKAFSINVIQSKTKLHSKMCTEFSKKNPLLCCNILICCFFFSQSFVYLHTSSWRQTSMCALLGRNSRYAVKRTIPTSTTMSRGNTPPNRSVRGKVEA